MSDIADIIGRYRVHTSKCLYIQPYMDAGKVAAFVKHVNTEMGTKMEAGSVHLLFAEKIVRSTVKGIAMTDDHLVVSMGMVGVFSLDAIESAEISGILNKRIKLRLEGGLAISFVLTQGNKSAQIIAGIIGQYISQP